MLTLVFRLSLDARALTPEALTEEVLDRLREIEAREIAQGKNLAALFRQAHEEYDVWPRHQTPALHAWHTLEDKVFEQLFPDRPRPINFHLVWVNDTSSASKLPGYEPLLRGLRSGA